jgi:carotenoid 1,2-hydratase
LVLQLDEVTAPWPRRIRGTVRLFPQALHDKVYALDDPGSHRWWPIAPSARVEVRLSEPRLDWQGRGYLDSNRGDAPLEDGFAFWHWSRAALHDGASAVLYDALRRDGSHASLALRFGANGHVDTFEAPPPATLPHSRWRIARATRSDSDTVPRLRRTLEDGPFYARSLVDAWWAGQPVLAMHESLQLDRFRRSWVQAMLPFRMPRRVG